MGPLEGIRIIDLSAVVSGPMATALSADQGADVIKIERLGAGDIQRHVGSSRNGYSGMFHLLNRGKRSIAIDLSDTRGQELARKLTTSADVVVQNFRPGVADRLGLGFEKLREENERLVYVSISGFGETGPLSGRRAYDPIIQSYSGMAWVQGRPGKRPQQIRQLILDKLTAQTAVQALTAALLSRERTGKGQHVKVSMLDTAIAFLWPDAAADRILLGEGVDQRPPIGAAGHVSEYRDGWGCTMTLSQDEFDGMCRALELPDLLADPRFRTIEERMQRRKEWSEVLESDVAGATRRYTLEEAEARYAAEQVPFSRLHSLDDLVDDPQVKANAIFFESEHPVAGRMREVRPPAIFDGTPVTAGGPAPIVGEHTLEILREAGLEEDSRELLAEGVIE